MRRLALTSWSVHHSLGAPPIANHPADRHAIPQEALQGAALSLLELPAQLQDAGIGTLEICHFHLPTTDPAYLQELRAELDDASVELFSILIDTGNLTEADPDRRAAEVDLIASWIDVAGMLGARATRVIAGQAPASDEAALDLSIDGLRRLARHGRKRGVRVITENFRSLASTAAICNRIIDSLGGEVGLCADIGNFPGDRRVAEFMAVAPRAESIHVKASYDSAGRLEPGQVRACLDASVAAGFEGPYTLVYDRGGDEWQGIARLKEVVEPYTSRERAI